MVPPRRLVAAAAALVALAGAGVVAARGDGDPVSLNVAASLPGDPAPLPTTPPATPSAPPTELPTAVPTQLPTTRPTVVPTTVPPTTDLPTRPPLPTPEPLPPVEVVASHQVLPTATRMVVTVRWRPEPGLLVRLRTDDGHLPLDVVGCDGDGRYEIVRAGPVAVAKVLWSYRRAGTYDLVAETYRGSCGRGPARTQERSAPARVVVTRGDDVANGPWEPRVSFRFEDAEQADASDDVAPHTYWTAIDAWEPDGMLWKFEIDFHDGSEPEVVGPPSPQCVGVDMPETTWPWGGHSGSYTSHTFPEAGEYRVTVTAFSASCDAADVQRTSTSRTLVVR